MKILKDIYDKKVDELILVVVAAEVVDLVEVVVISVVVLIPEPEKKIQKYFFFASILEFIPSQYFRLIKLNFSATFKHLHFAKNCHFIDKTS